MEQLLNVQSFYNIEYVFTITVFESDILTRKVPDGGTLPDGGIYIPDGGIYNLFIIFCLSLYAEYAYIW